jgi:parallel beta-helix repeat protein
VGIETEDINVTGHNENTIETRGQILISSNTTWTPANSPYVITGNVLVENGVTLTIQPGVEVRFDGDYYLKIDGTLVAVGTKQTYITFTSHSSKTPGSWDTIYFSPQSNNAVFDENGNYTSGCILKYCIIEYGGSKDQHFNELFDNGAVCLENAEPFITYNLIRNNIQGIAHEFSYAKISNNTIYRNKEYGIKGHSSYLTIENNIISNNKKGIHAQDHSYINNNVISGNKGLGLWFYGGPIPKATNNHIVNNGGIGIYSFDGPAAINYNNIYGNGDYQISRDYEKYGRSSNYGDINASNNWWGTTDSTKIDDLIYDFYDDFALGKVNYKPFLQSSKNPRNTPPIAEAGKNLEVSIDQTVNFNGGGSSDFEEDTLSYNWDYGDEVSSGWQSSNKSSHNYNKTGTYTVTMTVSDGEFTDHDMLSVTITESINNNAPLAKAGLDQEVYVNEIVYFDGGSSFDPDGDRLEYSWDFGDGMNGSWQSNTNATHSYNKKGTYTVTLTVSDGKLTDSDLCIVTVKEKISNQPPVASAGIDQYVNENELVQFNGSSSYDPDGNELTFKWDFGDGTITETGPYEAVSHSYDKAGEYTVTLTVNDGEFTSYDLCIVYVKVKNEPEGNSLPKILSEPVNEAYVGIQWSYIPDIVDDDVDDNIYWHLSYGPAGMAVESDTLIWIPEADQIGAHSVRINASDYKGISYQDFSIIVMDGDQLINTPPRIVLTKPIDNSKNIHIDDTEISITFSKSMNTSSVELAVSISPSVNYKLYWGNDNSELLIVISESYSYGTLYSVTITDSAIDTEGIHLSSPYEMMFTSETLQVDKDNIEKENDDKDTRDNQSNQIISITLILLIVVLIILIVFSLIIQTKKKKKDYLVDDSRDIDDRYESFGNDISDRPEMIPEFEQNHDDLINTLKEEALAFNKPSNNNIPVKELLNKTNQMYRKGEISEDTYNSIEEKLR